MKKLISFCLALPLFFVGVLSLHAQGDIVTYKPQHGSQSTCAFNLTITNKNTDGKFIDEIKLVITDLSGNDFDQFILPIHWTLANQTSTPPTVDATADNGGIAPNQSMSGFIFSYLGASPLYDVPTTITWTTRSGGADVSTGTIQPVCTQYQSFDKIDTATVIPSTNGGDPCFTFTIINRNLQQGTYNIPIWNVAISLQSTSAGTLRPSKVTPAQGWILDSVTTYTAYFHTENTPIDDQNPAVGGFMVCLRGNTQVNKFNFVWSAFDQQNAFIDRDTIFNISNTATSSATENDVVSVTAKDCLYTATLKNYHISNLLPPSRIVKFTIRSKTPGITFDAAPTAPPNWTKSALPADSIVYTAKTLSDGIPSGIVTNQFSFSAKGPTTSGFNIGWETFRTQGTISTGTISNLNCKVAVPATDSAIVGPGNGECNFKLTVLNSHNIKPQSNINMVTISIPANTGQLTPGIGPTGWNATNVSTTQIKYQAQNSTDALQTGNSGDITFSLTPKTPGTDVVATWSTFDEQSPGTPLSTGTVTIKCTPIISLCDTFFLASNVNSDSCVKSFTLWNRKTSDIVTMVLTTTDGWKIDTASTPPGWTKQIDGSHTTVTYQSESGLKAGESQLGFEIKFSGYFPDPTAHDNFTVVALTTDKLSGTCTSTAPVTTCLAHFLDTSIHIGVAQRSEDLGVSNFIIQPNPTHGSASIFFDLQIPQRMSLVVLDVLGHVVTTISNKLMNAGTYNIPYLMNGLPDGTYYIRMQTPRGVMTRKIVLTK